uniref:Uncharacterized protein n=1 Tax=Anguilla anguilla TaxID=7936 RepID=A0A0E9XU18_ANGAN
MKQHYKRGMRKSDCNRVMATVNELNNENKCKSQHFHHWTQ